MARLPVYALGGVGARTARRLAGSGAAGFAAVEALAQTLPAGPRRPGDAG
jgi:thiamine monophosphate synthase